MIKIQKALFKTNNQVNELLKNNIYYGEIFYSYNKNKKNIHDSYYSVFSFNNYSLPIVNEIKCNLESIGVRKLIGKKVIL